MTIISKLFLIIFVIILLYQLYKNRPIKKKIFFLSEGIAIFTILFIGYSLLNVVKTDTINKYGTYMADRFFVDMNTASENYNNNICMRLMIHDIASIDANSKLNQYKGIALRSYDQNGNLLFESGDKGLYIMTVERDSNKNQIYDLEAYFDSKEIDTMLKELNEMNEFILLRCSYMKGIEKNGQFIPQEIKLIDTNTNKEYVLGKADINAITLGYTNITSDSNVVIEFIGFNTTHKVSKTLKELKKKDHKYIQLDNNMLMLGSRSSLDIKYYGHVKTLDGHVEFEIAVDETALPLHTYLYKTTMLDIIIFIQIITIVVYLLYVRYNNKKNELDTARNVFMNAMAHEMKTPASIIKNSTELLRENIHPEKHEHYMDTIEKEADHLNDLLVELLNYTRTNQDYHIHNQDISLKALIEEVRTHYQNDTIQFTLDCDESIIINSDLALLSMLIDNYISNAYDHALTQVNIKAVGNRLEVSNDGEMIDSKDIDHIWDPFYKGDESRKNRQKTGLGLSLVANIAKLLHLKYGVDQKENEVTFFIEW